MELSNNPNAIKSREYRAAHPEKVKEYEKRRSEEQKERRRAYHREKAAKNREQRRAENKAWRESLPPERKEELRQRQREYYRTHKKEMSLQSRAYRLANREKLRAYQIEYQKKYRSELTKKFRDYINSDPGRKIVMTIGNRIRELCKRWSLKKQGGRSKYLEADGSVYAQHIESQFEPWMTWENHGTEWQIDHIVPCEILLPLFGRTDMLAERAVNQLCNLRPLKTALNISKSDQVPDALRIDLSKLIQENPVNPDLMSFVRKWSVLMRDWKPEIESPSP